jgi:hypothetical protein
LINSFIAPPSTKETRGTENAGRVLPKVHGVTFDFSQAAKQDSDYH